MHSGPSRGRARKSRFLLTGGLAVCDRCGKNLVGHKDYYVCGSEPYRGGKGCGPGVYVPQLLLDDAVITDIKGIIASLSDPQKFTQMVNEELRRAWELESGYDPHAEKHIADIDRKITHLRKLLEDGLDDVDYANSRLRDLRSERDTLSEALTKPGQPLQVDSKKAMTTQKQLREVLQHGKPEEQKEIIRPWVDKITLFPESRELDFKYCIPAQITNHAIMNNHNTAGQATFRKNIAPCLRGRIIDCPAEPDPPQSLHGSAVPTKVRTVIASVTISLIGFFSLVIAPTGSTPLLRCRW